MSRRIELNDMLLTPCESISSRQTRARALCSNLDVEDWVCAEMFSLALLTLLFGRSYPVTSAISRNAHLTSKNLKVTNMYRPYAILLSLWSRHPITERHLPPAPEHPQSAHSPTTSHQRILQSPQRKLTSTSKAAHGLSPFSPA
jgi:hypothetical protein